MSVMSSFSVLIVSTNTSGGLRRKYPGNVRSGERRGARGNTKHCTIWRRPLLEPGSLLHFRRSVLIRIIRTFEAYEHNNGKYRYFRRKNRARQVFGWQHRFASLLPSVSGVISFRLPSILIRTNIDDFFVLVYWIRRCGENALRWSSINGRLSLLPPTVLGFIRRNTITILYGWNLYSSSNIQRTVVSDIRKENAYFSSKRRGFFWNAHLLTRSMFSAVFTVLRVSDGFLLLRPTTRKFRFHHFAAFRPETGLHGWMSNFFHNSRITSV